MYSYGKTPREKSRLLLDIVQKGGGVQPESKSFGIVFFGLSFGHFPKKGVGLNPFEKFWGSFEVVLVYFSGCFEVIFGGMFFPKSA